MCLILHLALAIGCQWHSLHGLSSQESSFNGCPFLCLCSKVTGCRWRGFEWLLFKLFSCTLYVTGSLQPHNGTSRNVQQQAMCLFVFNCEPMFRKQVCRNGVREVPWVFHCQSYSPQSKTAFMQWLPSLNLLISQCFPVHYFLIHEQILLWDLIDI